MTIAPLNPAQNASIVTTDCAYPWDEWEPLKYQSNIDDKLEQTCARISERAKVALTTAIGEWIYQRFSAISSDRVPLDLCEAAWAGIIHQAYFRETEMDDDAWRGPVRGVLIHMMDRVQGAVIDLYEQEIEDNGRKELIAIWNIARHVLPETTAFDAWFDECVVRLLQHFPRPEPPTDKPDALFDSAVDLGTPVPRALFDTDQEFDPRTTDASLDAFLRDVEQSGNAFVNTAQVLTDIDEFTGTPFRYP